MRQFLLVVRRREILFFPRSETPFPDQGWLTLRGGITASAIAILDNTPTIQPMLPLRRTAAWLRLGMTLGLLWPGFGARAATILDPLDAPGVTDQQYRDLGATHPEVGQVMGAGFNGSGTYIGGTWVLTAGHIAFAKSGGTFSIGGATYPIVRSLTAPGYSFGLDANDVGLVELGSAVLGIAPAPIFSLADDAVLLGQITTWVGYGQGGTGRTGAIGQPGTVRGFTNKIDGFGPTFGLVPSSMFADFDRPDGLLNSITDSDPFPTAWEGNVAPGDSGGGVFLDGFGMVGVISYRARLSADPVSNSDYGELSGASRLNQFSNWITTQTGITSIPEPTSLTYLGASLILCLRRKRNVRRN